MIVISHHHAPRAWRILPRVAFAAALFALGTTAGTPHAAADTTPETPLFSRQDLGFGAVAGVAVTAAAFNDSWLTEESLESRTAIERHAAHIATPMGTPAVVFPALAVVYATGLATQRPDLSRAAERAGIAVGTAGLCALAMKETVGRERPRENPENARSFRPFSGHASFPSGHTTVAFAAAAALDAETSSPWIAWTGYAAAGLVAWARVHDNAHWTSDVVAGAALGAWTAGKTDAFLRDRDTRGAPIHAFVLPRSGGLCAGVTGRF